MNDAPTGRHPLNTGAHRRGLIRSVLHRSAVLGLAGRAQDDAAVAATGRRRFRPDIEGLRAIAVVLVVAFHAGIPGITGGYVGVDVFYVISGFLITGLLMDELERTGTISLRSFYARRVRRLLPLAALVLLAVAVGMQFFTPPVFRPTVRFDALSAAFYYSNWQFALESVNYLTLGGAQNPVLHYWSLSVEEQFYVAWPVLLVLAVAFRRGRGPGVRARCALVIAAIGGASLAYSVVRTSSQPAIAYFETTTRMWEFAAGAVIALALPQLLRTPRALAGLAGIAGLAAIAAAVATDGPTTEFPGLAALLPVMGAALVVAAGAGGSAFGVTRLLSVAPLRFIGTISYAWYLWHWPCLVFARTAHWAPTSGRIGWLATGGAVAISLALAIVTHVLVEVPARRAAWFAIAPRRVALLGGSATATAVIALVIFGGPFVLPSGDIGLIGGANASTIPAAATPLAAASSSPYAAMRGCHVGYSAEDVPSGCVFGATTARRTIVLVGDSHAAQWFPALELLARREHFRLIAWTKSGCPLAPGVHLYLPAIGRQYGECREWSANVLRRMHAMPRASLIIDARTSTYLPQVLSDDDDTVPRAIAARLWGAGFVAGVAGLQRDANRVVVLRDTPHAPQDIPACISWNPSHPARCNFARTRDGHSDDAEYAAERAAGIARAAYADPAPAVCGGAVCRAVVNGIITYRDDNHLTAAYSASIRRGLAQALSTTGRRAV
jgi:peptidoglycan/LPS O-acetylase OafA/YrhL